MCTVTQILPMKGHYVYGLPTDVPERPVETHRGRRGRDFYRRAKRRPRGPSPTSVSRRTLGDKPYRPNTSMTKWTCSGVIQKKSNRIRGQYLTEA